MISNISSNTSTNIPSILPSILPYVLFSSLLSSDYVNFNFQHSSVGQAMTMGSDAFNAAILIPTDASSLNITVTKMYTSNEYGYFIYNPISTALNIELGTLTNCGISAQQLVYNPYYVYKIISYGCYLAIYNYSQNFYMYTLTPKLAVPPPPPPPCKFNVWCIHLQK